MSGDMDSTVIQEIRDLVEDRMTIKGPDGETYALGNYRKIEAPLHQPETLRISTLKSFVQFIKDNINELRGAIVVVNDDFTVDLLSEKDLVQQKRALLLRAKFPMDLFKFNSFYDQESFMIALQSRFLFEDSEQDVFRIVSNLVIDNGVSSADNGMSMKLTLKHGISSSTNEEVKVRSVVELQPYRYFAECKQVISPFLLRLSISPDGGALAGLWECDGGAWRIDAYLNIFDELKRLECPLPMYW